jgi:hypothetical protein
MALDHLNLYWLREKPGAAKLSTSQCGESIGSWNRGQRREGRHVYEENVERDGCFGDRACHDCLVGPGVICGAGLSRAHPKWPSLWNVEWRTVIYSDSADFLRASLGHRCSILRECMSSCLRQPQDMTSILLSGYVSLNRVASVSAHVRDIFACLVPKPNF